MSEYVEIDAQELNDYISNLEDENEALKAQVEQLHKGFSDLQSCHLNSEYYKTLSKIRVIFNATPAQCLAEIKAQAGRDSFIAGANDAAAYIAQQINAGSSSIDLDTSLAADKYANQLRQQAKGE